MTGEMADLFSDPGDRGALSYHTGIIQEFNLGDGTNTVLVAGSPLDDLSLLNLGDAVNLDVGDVVGIIKFQNSMFIVGRIFKPGSGALYSGALSAFSETLTASGYGLTTSEVIQATNTRVTPAWANAVIIMASLHATGRNDRGAQDYMRVRVHMDLGVASGDGGEIFAQGDPSPNPSYATASASWAQAGLLAGGSTYTIAGKVRSTNGAWTAHADNHMDLTYTIISTKV